MSFGFALYPKPIFCHPVQEAMPTFHHGAVLETIMAVMHGVQGDRISAGVGRSFVRLLF